MSPTESTSSKSEIKTQTVLGVIFVCTLSVAAMFHVWQDIISIAYHDPEASHIFLVPFVITWLVWYRKGISLANTDGFGAEGLLLVLLGFFAHEVGLAYSLIVLWHFSAVLVVFGGFGLAFGAANFRALLAPLTALLFAVPVPGLIRQQMSLPLQYHSAKLTKFVLQVLGIELEQNGIVLSLNDSFVTVAEACNGVRMLMALLLLVYAFSFSQRLPKLARIALLVASPLIVLFLNSIRIIISVWAFIVLPEQIATSVHEISGWIICLGTLAGMLSLFRSNHEGVSYRILPADLIQIRLDYIPKACGIVCLAGLLVFGIATVPPRPKLDNHHQRVKTLFDEVPFVIDDWVAKEEPLHEAEIDLLKPNAAFRRVYRNLKTDKEVTVLAIATKQARDLVGHEPSICLTGQGWTQEHQTKRQWQVKDLSLNLRDFYFSWPKSNYHLRVVSLLIRPDGLTTGDSKSLAAAASDYRLQPFGAAAIRISNDDTLSDQEWTCISKQFLAAFSSVVKQFRKTSSPHASARKTPGHSAT